MIEISQLRVSFTQKQVLKGITAQFETGQVHGIIGLNGAGKTTFFNSLARYLKPDGGEIALNGKPLQLKDIAFLETGNYFYPGLTGNDYLRIFETTNSSFSLEGMQQLMQLPLDELISQYSTGMKKKLAMLAILKQDKPIYLFDEPFNGLDMETNKVVELIISNLRSKGKTIFISSHILAPLLQTCNNIHLLSEGSFASTYTPDAFNLIEQDLFKTFTERAGEIVSGAM
jgi:ABC-2 type transport system ATP-binding protein